MTIYLDSNIFIYALTDNNRRGLKCRELIKAIEEGKQNAATSVLTFNEGCHVIKKLMTQEHALAFSEKLISTSNLTLIDINQRVIMHAIDFIKKYNLGPADAIHIATAFMLRSEIFYSYDKDLRKVKEIVVKEL